MTKKLFVPEYVAKAAQKAIKGASELPQPIENAFGKAAKSKNRTNKRKEHLRQDGYGGQE